MNREKMKQANLSDYKKKRKFSKTPEPSAKEKKISKKPIYVIQKHASRRLHYDFRLEIDGVLKSWAIPKGPSLNPKEKRLAIETEDHPKKYADFEGVIPKGEYGEGVVMIWDKGSFKSITDLSLSEMYAKGEMEIDITGKKIKGKYALFKISTINGKKSWLLIKMKDKYADATKDPVKKHPNSVKSKKSLAGISRG
jgi:DNA ligase D-like protein (predicted 3'-phosphoesterase)